MEEDCRKVGRQGRPGGRGGGTGAAVAARYVLAGGRAGGRASTGTGQCVQCTALCGCPTRLPGGSPVAHLTDEALVVALKGAGEEVEVEGAGAVGATLPHKGCTRGGARLKMILTSAVQGGNSSTATARIMQKPEAGSRQKQEQGRSSPCAPERPNWLMTKLRLLDRVCAQTAGELGHRPPFSPPVACRAAWRHAPQLPTPAPTRPPARSG